MKDKYARKWSIRGTTDVANDIYLWAGHRFRLRKFAPGQYSFDGSGCDADWNTCSNLQLMNEGKAATIANLMPCNSETLSAQGNYYDAIRAFLATFPINLEHLTGQVQLGISTADVYVWVPKCATSNRQIIVITLVHNGAAQSGTAHGDPD